MSKDPQSLPPEKLPQVTAFQDEFTRKFMDSTEPVKEGYYLFRSGVNGYTMLFPEGAKVAKNWYHAPDRFYEDIEFRGNANNVSYYVRMEYEEGSSTNLIDIQLNMIRTALDYNGEFQEIKSKEKTIYAGKNTFKGGYVYKSKSKEENAYNFFSFIKSNDTDQGVTFLYSVTCNDVNKNCHLDLNEEEEKAKALMDSVKFIKQEISPLKEMEKTW